MICFAPSVLAEQPPEPVSPPVPEPVAGRRRPPPPDPDMPIPRRTDRTPPRWDGGQYDRYVHSGDEVVIQITATDDDRDQLTVSTKELPAGAKLRTDARAGHVTAKVTWRPPPGASGTYTIQFIVSDGTSVDTADVVVHVSDEWESFFMPGLRYGAYQPRSSGTYGTYHGPAIELVFASWIHKNDKRGPSHGRTHLDMEVLTPTKKGLPAIFDIAFAFDLSMERNPRRNFLIPHFGLRTGATLNKGVEGKGTLWHVTPVVGAYLYADQNLFVTLQAGYVMPLSSEHFDSLRGVRGGLSVNYIAW